MIGALCQICNLDLISQFLAFVMMRYAIVESVIVQNAIPNHFHVCAFVILFYVHTS